VQTLPQHRDLWLCGWHVRSELPLPELLPWAGAADHEPDIVVRLGDVPDRLPGAVDCTPFRQFNAEGAVRFAVDGVAAYLVEGGNRVTVSCAMPVDAADIALFFLGSVFGFLCHQRGVLPLHASCIEIDGRTIAFSGVSGAGKSTLAAALVQRGYKLLADDVTVIAAARGSPPTVLPSFPRQKLWRDSLTALSISEGRRLRQDAAFEKFEHTVLEQFCAQPRPLHSLALLSTHSLAAEPVVERVTGQQAFEAVWGAVYRPKYARMPAHAARLFAQCSQMARELRVAHVRRPRNLNDLTRFIDALPELLRDAL
jgi:hypothetical protein